MSVLPYFSEANRTVRRTLPGSAGLPVLGYSLAFLNDPVKVGTRLYGELGPVYWINAFGMTFLQMQGPEANQFVFRNQDDVFSNNQGWDFYIGKFFKRGIMLLDFEEHRHHRGIMQAAFKKPVLVEYLKRMNPAIEKGIGRWQTGNDFPVLKKIKQLTLDMATDVFMGEQLGPEADKVNQAFVDCVRAGTSIVRFPVPGGRWKKGLDGRKVLEDFFRSRIAHKRAHPGEDLFSRLCQAEDELGRRFSDDDVINHMIFLMMAAHDTSTITLCSIIYHLAKYPEWQERVRAEALALGKRDLDHDDLAKLEATSLVMKEALRMIAPVHGIPRKTVKDCEFMGHHIPAGTFIAVSPMVSHHLPNWWEKPEVFDPERFTEARNEHRKHPYLYVPFGGGAHMCIGLHFAEMQIKAILHHVVQQYRWSVPEDYVMPVDFTSLPVPGDGLPVKLERL
ncbi:MAG: cytochrome P450 [Moraxellaceae bacterium]|nr:cytochrome P450 [Moraxellaceae bacterium]